MKMTIKDQAIEALRLNPLAKTFMCNKQCDHEGCVSYERYTIHSFNCVACRRRENLVYIAKNPELHKKRQKEWNEKNHDYRLLKARADWHRRKEAKRESV